jgi:hypothetical protein
VIFAFLFPILYIAIMVFGGIMMWTDPNGPLPIQIFITIVLGFFILLGVGEFIENWGIRKWLIENKRQRGNCRNEH